MFFCRQESLTSNDPSKILKEARKIIEKIRDKCRENDHSTPFIKSSGLKSKPGWFYTFRTGLKLNSIRFSPLPTCPFLPRC